MGGAGVEPVYVEELFQTHLYTGNGSTQTINNGIDLAGEGGLVWLKNRSNSGSHLLFDTVRGADNLLQTNQTNAQINSVGYMTTFNAAGFGLTSSLVSNASAQNYASWTFRKQPKFFDVVTWIGNGGAARTIPHNLGSVPGCMIVKKTSSSGTWFVYHRLLDNGNEPGAYTVYAVLNTTAAADSVSNQGNQLWGGANPTSTVFTVGTGGFGGTVNGTNDSGATYVAYLFAHNAGGFGLTGTDNVISCGSYVGNGSTNGPTVNLGYEPQWLLCKRATGDIGDWYLMDTMRGWGVDTARFGLYANTSTAEAGSAATTWSLNSTGFQVVSNSVSVNASGSTYIYIAIRRGPMKVPTTGTSVFSPNAVGVSAQGTVVTTSFPVDLQLAKANRSGSGPNYAQDRLRGVSTTTTDGGAALATTSTAAEDIGPSWTRAWSNTGFQVANQYALANNIYWNFRRAPGFFDEICFSGTGANTTQAHNLQKAPELWLVKSRSAATEWVFGSSLLGANEKIVMPSPNGRVTDTTVWNNTYPTASVLSLGTSSTTNASGATFVSYLWATVAGVSKVGTYTGNGSSQTIDCGFAGGARFVMIIRATASTAQDIYIWDTARGIVSGNDPRLSLNTTAAEVTTLDTIDTTSSGFVVNTDASNVNVNGAVYLYLSIA
jgi:hypothetical protein